MADTYTLIEKIAVGAAGASSVTFTSIPQTYTDLKIVTSARTTSAIAEDFLYARFNADSGSNYTLRLLRGNGSTVASGTITSGTYAYVGQIEGTSNTASTFTNSECYIPNYTSSNQKSYSTDTVAENNATSTYEAIIAGIWTGTAAISSIVLTPAQGNFTQYSTFYLYGIAKDGVSPAPSSAPYATGGDSIVFDGTYWYHTFLSTGTFTPKKGLSCDVLVVAGGGGSSSQYAGGAGAGGVCHQTSRSVSTATTVTVGAGGARATTGNSLGSSGADSVFDTITALGGGGGSSPNISSGNGQSGGSGSGAAYNGSTGGTATQGSSGGATGYGNAGGAGLNSGSQPAGGGGGAGTAGSAGSGSTGGNGGNGLDTWSTWASATSTGVSGYYAGGGGGNIVSPGTYGSGGLGGGGAANSSTGVAGTANTGGGAGAGASNASGGSNGGSGIVIVRYAA